MTELFAHAAFFGAESSEPAVKVARDAGWSSDEDGWWLRALRAGDKSEAEFFKGKFDAHGFICDGIVYVRTADIAMEFDAAAESPSLKNGRAD